MRKLIVFLGISLDGYHADVDGEIDWQTFGDEFTAFSREQLEEVDALLFGRTTYEGMAQYWPEQVGRDFDDVIAERMNSITKYVVSRTLTRADWQHTAVLRDVAEVAGVKEEAGGPIAVFGSSTLAVHLLRAGLVDELRLMVNPVVLGAGVALLAGADLTNFTLVGNRQFTTGAVLLTYAPS